MTNNPDQQQQPEQIETLQAHVADLQHQLSELRSVVTTDPAAATADDPDGSHHGPDTESTAGDLNDQSNDESAEQQLIDWVGWLCDTYCLETSLREWQTTPALRQELIALKRGHDADHPTRDMYLIFWHDALERFINRIERHNQRWKSQQRAAQEAAKTAERRRQAQTNGQTQTVR